MEAYRGFESHPVRHLLNQLIFLSWRARALTEAVVFSYALSLMLFDTKIPFTIGVFSGYRLVLGGVQTFRNHE